MAEDQQRRKYHPRQENIPLGEAIREAIAAHETAENTDVAALDENFDIQALNRFVSSADEILISLELRLPNVTVEIWSNGGVTIEVTENSRRKPLPSGRG